MLGNAVGDVRRQARGLLALLGNAYLAAGDKVELLRFIGAVINAHREVGVHEVLVGNIGPVAPPGEEFALGIPVAVLVAKSGLGHMPGGQKNMDVRAGRIVAVHGDVGDHAFGDKGALGEVAEQGDVLGLGELDG